MSRGLGCLSFVQEGPRISWAETVGSMHFGGIYPDFNPSFLAPEERPFALSKSTVLNKLSSVSNTVRGSVVERHAIDSPCEIGLSYGNYFGETSGILKFVAERNRGSEGLFATRGSG